MVLGLAQGYAPDAIERALPDPASARERMHARCPEVYHLLTRRRDALGASAELARCEDALLLGLARMALRHGSWGDDYHDYHNEAHALEILDGRIERLIQAVGVAALAPADWMALSLFAVCHDLRQREPVDYTRAVGNNEGASLAEAQRILDACGYDRERDRGQYLALELSIAGSTFDARPAPFNPAEAVASGGALAPRLPAELDAARPGWREDADIQRALRLALIASDLDTANVAEPIPQLGESALRLCRERERLAGRALDARASAEPCLRFLSNGQERYFFELHRFCSPEGEAAFAPTKAENAPRVRALSQALRDRFGADGARAANGAEVLAGFEALLADY